MFLDQNIFRKRYFLSLLFAIGLVVSLTLEYSNIPLFNSAAIAQTQSAEQQMQQGVDRYSAGDFEAAITSWQSALAAYQTSSNVGRVAIASENLARAYQALGQTSEELQYWQRAGSAYQQLGDRLQVGRMLVEQAQAHSRLGQYGEAVTLLCNVPSETVCAQNSALGSIESLPDSDQIGEVAALGSLGDAYRLLGEPDRAVPLLNRALMIARELQKPDYLVSTLNSLGNAQVSLAQADYRRAVSSRQIEEEQEAEEFEARAQQFDAEALKHLQESFSIAQVNGDRSGQLRALVSALPIYFRFGQTAERASALQEAISLIATLPPAQEKVYASIDIARFVQLTDDSVTLLTERQCVSQTIDPQAQALLEQAIATAQQIANLRAKSFALGELGHLYECQGNYEQALTLTRQAQLTADQELGARDSLYLWQWQAGRIFNLQGKSTEAIRAYEESLDTLDALREDILTAGRDIQFDFRETVEPIYRELVKLRLQQEQPSVLTSVRSQNEENNVSRVLNTLDTLKLAELQNYFGNDCVLTALNEVDINSASNVSDAAIFSTVLLNDRVAVILNIPTQSITGEKQTLQQFEWIKGENNSYVSQDTATDVVNEYRKGLENLIDSIPGAPLGGYDPTLAKQLYDWIIRPFESVLEQNEVQTLVFVQDGIFRSAPMAALYNGNQFLVEKYAIAVTPSLRLTDLETTDRQQLRALALGLTQRATVDGTDFPALRYVESELQAVQEIFPGSIELQDENFTRERLEQTLETDTFPIVHIATHGEFSAEAENAFLVTGSDPAQPNQKLTINILDDIIRQTSSRNPIELLVLSACRTATGDDRAALGLAGIAAQAGARRVLASLWSINDQATTEIVSEFYQGLVNPNITKAQALQAAQKVLIESEQTAHPFFWSAFILIGNWL
ncbi:MAG: CHAT domain-containing protein [Leptolyngbyaceae cyanobacterium SM1_4_3]|nr:CHAT domain-containing protein [Leptolyngbyaceae cyanobacterium SM1_4_3]